MEFDQLSNQLINYAIRVNKELGAALFEEVYKTYLNHKLIQNNFKVESELSAPIQKYFVTSHRFDESKNPDILRQAISINNLHYDEFVSHCKLIDEEYAKLQVDLDKHKKKQDRL